MQQYLQEKSLITISYIEKTQKININKYNTILDKRQSNSKLIFLIQTYLIEINIIYTLILPEKKILT